MCLIIDKKHRMPFRLKYNSEVTQEDIWVWKILIWFDYDNTWATPCMFEKIRFKDGKYNYPKFTKDEFELTVDIICDKNQNSVGVKSAFGYHSYIKKPLISDPMRIFRAKIPKGSYVYYGTNGDLCSNCLIIYEKE